MIFVIFFSVQKYHCWKTNLGTRISGQEYQLNTQIVEERFCLCLAYQTTTTWKYHADKLDPTDENHQTTYGRRLEPTTGVLYQTAANILVVQDNLTKYPEAKQTKSTAAKDNITHWRNILPTRIPRRDNDKARGAPHADKEHKCPWSKRKDLCKLGDNICRGSRSDLYLMQVVRRKGNYTLKRHSTKWPFYLAIFFGTDHLD